MRTKLARPPGGKVHLQIFDERKWNAWKWKRTLCGVSIGHRWISREIANPEGRADTDDVRAALREFRAANICSGCGFRARLPEMSVGS